MKKTRKTAPNPRRIPRSQADVDKAYEKGLQEGTDIGVQRTLTITLFTLQDKMGMDEETLEKFSESFNYVLDSITKNYAEDKDYIAVLKDEYDTEIEVRDD